MNTSTTLRELRESEACRARYRHLAKSLGGVKAYGMDTPVDVLTIITHNGLDDAEWALGNCPSLKLLCDEYRAKRKPLDDEYLAKCAALLVSLAGGSE